MQIKTTMRYHAKVVRMATIKKCTKSTVGKNVNCHRLYGEKQGGS